MKKKLLSVAMAVVMAMVCLAGCSGYFSKDSFISAAKKNGMKEIKETTELNHILADTGEHIAFWYDDKDIKVFEFTGSPLTDYVSKTDVDEYLMAAESIGKTDDHGRCLTRIFYLTVKDSDTAEEIYEAAIRPLGHGAEESKKDGVTYTISYQGSKNEGSTVELACGVYLKDDQIIWIRSDYDSTLKNKCVESFCKSLGLVSPYTLK